jgi:hypothetical protein
MISITVYRGHTAGVSGVLVNAPAAARASLRQEFLPIGSL